ncbi:hypothetical protein SH580_12535 [Coraliomargarita algicola]|uniref:Outer membrane lipoprotein-sorting protein n=1 Tax=Coraliomargarita algicola TaxID=3092156 RepID=A0ABZ0RE53_9BACT|nr:hypothetical protein [Coraliomargarita sp. J2-16]WPJ94262.1 hypothetical protein SH580_12535 [Coraliomargarita sp. J2-16]
MFTFTRASGAAEPEPAEASPPAPPAAVAASQSQSAYAASIQRLDSMDTTGLSPDLVTVLTGYYRNSFTSQEHWDLVESIRFDGTLHLEQGVIRFTAFKKKPDYSKIVLFLPNDGRIVMAYDGADAWQLQAFRPGAEPIDMPADEALNFIRDATTGGHLLYPLVAGKTIELVGSATLNGRRHYDLRTTLPDGQTIRSLLDMANYAEAQQTTLNNVSGLTEVTTHGDFRVIDGIRLPFVSTLTVDGEHVHETRIERVQVNLGVMPWMFSRSSGANVPDPLPAVAPAAAASQSPRPLYELSAPDPRSQLRLGEAPFDPWSTQSAFEMDPADLSEQETADILNDLKAVAK